MLKIKKSKLKELENYGFIKWENGCGTTGYSNNIQGQINIIEKNKENIYNTLVERKLNIHQFINNENLLYDLIKDGLVEKVSDK